MDIKYIKAENKAYENLKRKGYTPQGYDMKLRKVVIFKIENENSNNEKREHYYFKNFQEADKNLL